MFEKVKILYRYMAMINAEGMNILCEAARDISEREKFRKPAEKMTCEQFDRSVKTVLAMVNRNWRDKQCQDAGYTQDLMM